MRTLNILFALLFLGVFVTSCSDDDDNPITEENPTENLIMVKSMEANGHTIELYSEKANFTVGYNDVYIRIKDASDAYVDNFTASWMPKMHMTMHTHACPFSTIENTEYASMKKGYIVFIMASNDTEYWELNINYNIGSQDYTASEQINVIMPSNGRRAVTSTMGTDGERYFLALVEPKNPEVAVNDATMMVFKKESMMSFPAVENFKITLDPRMPGMGNHSSPNNEDFIWNATTKLYEGKLSLTMTGYWKLNLKLLNAENDILAGEDVTDTNESSSLFVELEF